MKTPQRPKPARPTRPPAGASVLYIHPAKQGADWQPSAAAGRPYGLIPVGVAALVNTLRQNGIAVRGLNLPLEKQINPAFRLIDWLSAHDQAQVVLIDMHWYEHTFGATSVAQACKQALPNAHVVIGGLTASAFAGDILRHTAAVDFVIRGDAEKPLLDLTRMLLHSRPLDLGAVPNLAYRQDGQVVENALTYCATDQDLDRLNFTDLDFLEHADEYHLHEYIVTDLQAARNSPDRLKLRGRWLCNARGCKYNCSYCGGCKSAHRTLAGRNGIVPRSPAKMVQDLARLSRQRVIQASLTYDLAELGEPYWREFFDRLRRSGVSIGLYNELFQLPPPEFITDLARSVDMAQSCLAFSPLSGAERVRRLNGKYFANRDLFAALDVARAHNFYIFVYFSLNLPGEDEDTLIESIDLARDIYNLYPSSRLKIITSNHTLDPLSPMSLEPEKYGVSVTMTSFADFYAYCRDTGTLSPQARSEAHRGFAAPSRSLPHMADLWDAARVGRESCWWPVPPGW